MLAWIKKRLAMGLHNSGLLVFAGHMKEPLYRDYTRSGVLLGYIIRLIVLFYKALIFGLKSLVLLLVLALYFLLMPALIIMVIFQLSPLFLHA